MNIIIIDNSIAFTGAFKCALGEADILSNQHRFIFVLNNKSNLAPLLQAKGYTVYHLPLLEIRKSIPLMMMYPFTLLKNAIALKSIIRKERADIVQVNDFYNMLGVLVKMLGFKGKLLTYVRFLPSAMPATLRNAWIRAGLKYSHKMIGVSDAVLHQLPATDKTTRVYDPVLLSESLPGKTYTQDESVRILYLSNYIQGKGQDKALEAFINAYKTNKNIRLKFIGGDMGLTKNAQYKQQLELAADKAGIKEVIEFASFSADVEKEIKDADIMLNFSEAESFSMTCLEAAFYGTPLIATRCGGPEEIIEDGKTGITVPVNDVAAMSKAILQLAGSHELRREYAIAGKEYVRNKFNIATYKKQMEEIING